MTITPKRMLGIYAHPDDEGGMSGALLHYASSGVEGGLICATRGEVGEIADPALATPETLGQVREGELRAAAQVLGVQDQHIWFLDYRDSGMAGTADNDHPKAFDRVDREAAVGQIVAIIREFRPQVLITFDKSGGYGHPDHIAIHHYATEAFFAAADPARYPEAGTPFAPDKLYYASFPQEGLRAVAEWMNEHNPSGSVFRGADLDKFGLPEKEIDVWLNVERWAETKDTSWKKHRTQMGTVGPLESMPEDLRRRWRSYETFHLGESRVGPDVPGENDLFARIA